MIGGKLSISKSVLILIILFSVGTVLGVIAYSTSLKKSPPVIVQPTPTPTLKPTITPVPTPTPIKSCDESEDRSSCFNPYLSQNPIPDDIAKSDDKLKDYFSRTFGLQELEGISRGKFDKYSNNNVVIISFYFKNVSTDIFIIAEVARGKWQASYQILGGFEKFTNDPLQLVKNEPPFFVALDYPISGTCVGVKATKNIYRLENNRLKKLWGVLLVLADEGDYYNRLKANTTLIETELSFKDVNNDGNKEIIRQGTKKIWKGFCERGSDEGAIKIDKIYEVYKWNPSKQTFIKAN